MYLSSTIEVFRCIHISNFKKVLIEPVLPSSQRRLMVYHLFSASTELLSYHKSTALSHIPSSYKYEWLTPPSNPAPRRQNRSINFEMSDSCGWERSVFLSFVTTDVAFLCPCPEKNQVWSIVWIASEWREIVNGKITGDENRDNVQGKRRARRGIDRQTTLANKAVSSGHCFSLFLPISPALAAPK